MSGFKLKAPKPEPAALPDAITIKPVTASSSKPVSKIPAIAPRVLTYAQSYAGGRAHFIPPEYDLAEIGVIEDTDSYVRQAFDKKIGLMFKEGVSYHGPNPKTVQYVKTRAAQIEQASGIPHAQLLKRVSRSLVRTSNAFLIKVRKPEASGGRLRETPAGKKLKPVAGYFPAAPETMFVDLNPDTGKIRKWRQELPDGRFRLFNPDDVIHFTINRREGFIFGTPTIVPVIDDIRALRQLEENIEMLLYQHLFPLFQYKVGTEKAPAGLDEDGNKEIDVVKYQIRTMPFEGGIVTSERHEIKAIGAEGRAVRAEGYLDHFRKRVIAGLGISQIDLGDGDTTNRATANTLSRALIDTVKDIQDELEAQWNMLVVRELLLESTFGDEVLDEESLVRLEFREIDLVNKMELEKHNTELFEKNGITYPEYRNRLGLEPIEIPEDPEDQDPSKYPDWMNLNWKLFVEPENLINAVDEPYSVAAKQAAENRALGTTGQQLSKSKSELEEKAKKEAANKPAPAPKAVAKKASDGFLKKEWEDFEVDTLSRIQSAARHRRQVDFDYLAAHGRSWATLVGERMKPRIHAAVGRGFNDGSGGLSHLSAAKIRNTNEVLDARLDRLLDRLVRQTIGLIQRRIDAVGSDVTLNNIESLYLQQAQTAFDSTRYRTDFIQDVEVRRAYNFGRVLGGESRSSILKVTASAGACDRCRAACDRLGETDHISLTDTPPFHPGCKCSLTIRTRRAHV